LEISGTEGEEVISDRRSVKFKRTTTQRGVQVGPDADVYLRGALHYAVLGLRKRYARYDG